MLAMSEKIDLAMRLCVPYILMLILFLLNMISFSTPVSTAIEIPFVVIIIYYWSVYRPSLMSPLLIFMAGICLDFISGLPAGLSSFTFLIMHNIISQQRLFLTGQPFMVVWFGFVVVGFITLFVQWFLFGLINFQWTPMQPVLLAIISGSLLFPIISLALNLSNRILPILPDQYSAVK